MISAPNTFFEECATMLREGQTVRLRANGNSMYPFIRGGRDIITLRPMGANEEPKLMWALFFKWEGRYMTHRLIGKEGEEYLLMGDGNGVRIERVKRENIYGILTSIEKENGRINGTISGRWIIFGKWWWLLRKIRGKLIFVMQIFYQKK
jgi:hypothetical protein